MCLLFFTFDSHPRYRLILAANRDEHYDRPTQSAHFWKSNPQVLAGRDLRQNGTWLGVTRTGRWAAVTNFREAGENRPGLSRGALVGDYLNGIQSPAEYATGTLARVDDYSGFNLVVGDSEKVFYLSNRPPAVTELTRGTYGLSNHLLDTPWPKVESGKQGLSALLSIPWLDTDSLFALLDNPSTAADLNLPDTGVSYEWEKLLSAAFVSGERYGTRSSTVVLINSENNGLKLEERTYRGIAGQTPHAYTSVAYEFKVQVASNPLA